MCIKVIKRSYDLQSSYLNYFHGFLSQYPQSIMRGHEFLSLYIEEWRIAVVSREYVEFPVTNH